MRTTAPRGVGGRELRRRRELVQLVRVAIRPLWAANLLGEGAFVLLAGLGIILVVAVALLVHAFLSGVPGEGPVRPGQVLTGTVSAVDETEASVCVQPDRGPAVCSIPFQQRGAPALHVGERVQVRVAQIKTGQDSSIQILIVTSPAPNLNVPPAGG